MAKRLSQLPTTVAVSAGAAVLSALVFAAFFAPGMPRTVWGWLISASLGIPLLLLAEVIFTFAFLAGGGPRRSWRSMRGLPPRERAVHRSVFVARIVVAAAVFGGVLWLLSTFVLHNSLVRAQFR